MSGIIRGLILALGLILAQFPGFAQGGTSPRHTWFNGIPSLPRVQNMSASALQDTMRDDWIPPSIDTVYYNTTAGNPKGKATEATKVNWFTKSLTYLTQGLDSGVSGLDGWLNRATVQLQGYNQMLDNVQRQVLMPVESMEGFQQALQAYQLYRKFVLMKKSWGPSLFKIDLLDVLPTFGYTGTDEFGIPTTGIRVGLTYKSDASAGDIFSRSGTDNPFIGDWNTPKFKYIGPHKLSDIGLNAEPSAYRTANTDAVISVGQDMNEVMNRVFFEGVMGQYQATNGLAYLAPEEGRPSPKLLRMKMETISQVRAQQIEEEIKQVARMYAGKPDLIAAMTSSLTNELQYWLDKPDGIEFSQAKRLERLRNTLITANNETIKRESDEQKHNEAEPDSGNGFLDNVFNTYKTIGSLIGELKNDPNQPDLDGTGDTGPQIVHKANVQYAKATYSSFLEAQSLRRMLYSKLMAETQEKMADGFVQLARQVKKREGEVSKVEERLRHYQRLTDRIKAKLDRLGIQPQDIADAASTY